MGDGKAYDKTSDAVPETAVALPTAPGKSHVTVVHDKTEVDRAREDLARERAENAKVAKNKKRLTYMQVRAKAVKAEKKLVKTQAQARIAMDKAGKDCVLALIKEPPSGAKKIVDGWNALGHKTVCTFSYNSVKLVDENLKVSVQFKIMQDMNVAVGDEEAPYQYSDKREEYNSKSIWIDGSDDVKTTWAALQAADAAIRNNNEILTKVQDNLDMLEEMGEVAEASAIESGMNDERKKAVADLEDVFQKFLDDDLDDGGNLLQLAAKNG